MKHAALSEDSANLPRLIVTGFVAPVTTRQQNPIQFIVIYKPDCNRGVAAQARPITEKLLMNGPAMRGSLIIAP
jgi:hypothetical protein